MNTKPILIKKASENDLTEIVKLHSKLYPTDSIDNVIMSFVLIGGHTYVATQDSNIVGYVSIHTLLKSQLNDSICDFLKTISDAKLCTNVDNISNPFFVIPLAGTIPEHKKILPKLIDKAVKYCMKKDYLKTKYLIVFVKKNDIDVQNIYMSKGFLFTTFSESNMFKGPQQDDGILMYKKMNIINKILRK